MIGSQNVASRKANTPATAGPLAIPTPVSPAIRAASTAPTLPGVGAAEATGASAQVHRRHVEPGGVRVERRERESEGDDVRRRAPGCAAEHLHGLGGPPDRRRRGRGRCARSAGGCACARTTSPTRRRPATAPPRSRTSSAHPLGQVHRRQPRVPEQRGAHARARRCARRSRPCRSSATAPTASPFDTPLRSR